MFNYSTLNELLEQIKDITRCDVYDVEVQHSYWLITLCSSIVVDNGPTIRIKAKIPYK